MTVVLTFDIGGTYLRAGLYDSEGDYLISRTQCEVPGFRQFPDLDLIALKKKLYETMIHLSHNLGLTRPRLIGVAFPGPVDRGDVLRAPTLWGGKGGRESVADRIRVIWPEAQVTVFNDLTAAGYYYIQHVKEDFCVVTVSSGIGLKVFSEGRPVLGPRSRGGELGHLRVVWGDEVPICDCGGLGHLGAVASGRATAWQIQRLVSVDPAAYANSVHGGKDPEHLSNHEVANAFRNGDNWTQRLIRVMAQPLGWAIAAIHLIMGTERFVVIGGFAHALGDDYLTLLESAADESSWEPEGNRAWKFELGKICDDAGLIGVGRLISTFMHLSKR
jgi:glucokinase